MLFTSLKENNSSIHRGVVLLATAYNCVEQHIQLRESFIAGVESFNVNNYI